MGAATMMRQRRYDVGKAALQFQLIGTLPFSAVACLGSDPGLEAAVSALMLSALPALLTWLLGVLMAGEILHPTAFRGYLAGSVLPVLALVGMFLCWEAQAHGLSAWKELTDIVATAASGMVYALLSAVWIVIPAGWLVTRGLRQRYHTGSDPAEAPKE